MMGTLMIFLYLCGAVSSLVLSSRPMVAHRVSSVCAMVGSIVGIIFSGSLLVSKTVFTSTLTTSFPMIHLIFHYDGLSAFAVLLISVISFFTTIYGWEYMSGYVKTYPLGVFGCVYNFFIMSMVLVVTSYSAVGFLFFWELMSLTSLVLVMVEYQHEETIQAGRIYFIMTHIATMCLIGAFLLLGVYTGSFDFELMHASNSHLPVWVATTVFILTLVGFGTKAGIIPLHIWLPRAHSAAPSHVSSLMSGVMIKIGVLMMIRMYFYILGQPPVWWGVVVLLIASFSSLLGVLYALAEHDIKRLLAFHSIENIGIILLGVGASMIFTATGNEMIASLALVAALFHILNHAVFKSLLFLGAGAIISKTHTRNIEEYGGLLKRMPITAVCFLIGSLAISGLPPFNGFASEWLTYQNLFVGLSQQSMIVKGVFVVAIASLATTGGLAAMCFVKAFGITFLARPRSSHSQHATEVGMLMKLPMAILAFACLFLGVTSSFVSNQLLGIVQQHWLPVQLSLSIPGIVVVGIVTVLCTYIVVHILSNRRLIKRDITWNCGFTYSTPRMEITATGFALSLITIFHRVFRSTKEHDIDYINANFPYIVRSRKIHISMINIYETYLYTPVVKSLTRVSLMTSRIQNGNINLYILYICITLIGVMIWVRFGYLWK